MQPLNPFLRAFFASKLPFQCHPPAHHILLVPTTELLLTARDRDTQTLYTELVSNEEFLASHVLRLPGGSAPAASGKEALGFRDSKGKARQYTTLDGKTVVLKDTFVYSNKGFKSLTQAQLLHEEAYYTDWAETPQWLVYYISRPLLGTPEPFGIQVQTGAAAPTASTQTNLASSGETAAAALRSNQNDIKFFSDLLNNFPMIARQMQPGLERLFQQYKQDLEKPLPDLPFTTSPPSTGSKAVVKQRPTSLDSATSTNSIATSTTSGSNSFTLTIDENQMRRATETLVMSAIEIFQNVDKQQLSVLAAATNLSGPIVERMIERYVIGQVHDRILFPQVCAVSMDEDEGLERYIKQMGDVDISQVGIAEEEGLLNKRELARRVLAGVQAFKKMGVAGSPQEMIEVLLETEKRVSTSAENASASSETISSAGKLNMVSTNADTLVSLLLMVIIRSSIRHLNARLAYMRDFSFVTDVESGEVGYALSTYEAVLAYLSSNSKGLRKISRANRTLWQAVKKGDLAIVKHCLQLGDVGDEQDDSDNILPDSAIAGIDTDEAESSFTGNGHASHQPLEAFTQPTESHLAHVYPWNNLTPISNGVKLKVKKRVSMSTRSMSSSSSRSWLSRISVNGSVKSNVGGEVTPEQLCQTVDGEGNSILMMAIEQRQAKMLECLLSLNDLLTPQQVLRDCNNEGTSLLSAAVQVANPTITNVLLNYILQNALNHETIANYLRLQDSKGRTVAHYLFNAPQLINRLGPIFPWQLKDKNGQTPLFAMFRCYDHESYHNLVDSAMAAAAKSQGDEERLHINDHVDSKGNTLLHIVTDPKIIRTLLYQCDSDPNFHNDRRFTPLMVASKFARIDLVRMFFGDERVDLQARDLRGLTAVELAKDDEVRNRIDDMLLLSTMPTDDSRRTTIVRSFFVEDGTIRLVIKSGARNPNSTITVTTCRRSLTDFENLAQWLTLEHPASWLPSVLRFRSPFQIPSKPSRQILRDIQLRLDNFLQTLILHPTFGTHEMLWEFILVPDIDPGMLAERARRKAQARIEKLREEYEPLIENTSEVELFIGHARSQVLNVHHAFKAAFRHVGAIRNISSDLAEAQRLSTSLLSELPFLDKPHNGAMTRYAATLTQTESSPATRLFYTLLSSLSGTSALLQALARPTTLIRSINNARETIGKHQASASRSQRWPSALGLLDDTRTRREQESLEKAEKTRQELRRLGCELRYTQQTVAGELAGWQEGHAKAVREGLREWVRRMVVVEKDRLEAMKRAVRCLGKGGVEHA